VLDNRVREDNIELLISERQSTAVAQSQGDLGKSLSKLLELAQVTDP
jgi:hypothetical protein